MAEKKKQELTERQIKYNEFMHSSQWAEMREILFSNRGRKCESCKSKKQIQVHHLTYKRFGGKERPEDLMILCGSCHMAIHGLKLNGSKPKNKKKLGRMYYRRVAVDRLQIPDTTSTTWKGIARAIAWTQGNTIPKISTPKAQKYVKRMMSEYV